jgi:hypothetical protein
MPGDAAGEFLKDADDLAVAKIAREHIERARAALYLNDELHGVAHQFSLALRGNRLPFLMEDKVFPRNARVFFAPPAETIQWPKRRGWCGTYLKKGYDGLRPQELVDAGRSINVVLPDRQTLDRHLLQTFLRMGYARPALEELFARPEVKACPDLLVYDELALQATDGARPEILFDDNDAFLVVRMCDYLRRSGQIAASGDRGVVSERAGRLTIQLRPAIPLVAAACARLGIAAPTRNGVRAALGRAHIDKEPWLITVNSQWFTLDAAWARHNGLWGRT